MLVAEAEADGGLLADNLAAFGRHMPELFPTLDKYVPQTRLVTNPDGSHDVDFRGQRLYDVGGDGTTGPELARRMADELRGSQKRRVLLTPLDSKSVDSTTDIFVKTVLKKGVDSGMAFLESPNDDGTYHLVLMGLGLGYHLAELIKLVEPFSICIVEPNLDFLYHSLAVFDWRPILERRADWPQAVSIYTLDKAEDIAMRVRGHCRNANPTALDGTLIVPSYANDTMDVATKLFLRDAHLVHSGLGFFHDELEMVRASYFNLVPHDDFRMFRSTKDRAEVPAFVVGSGPSIDDDIDFLRENQDRAVIFSCGSALGVLLANGIRPDFEVVLENGEAPRQMLESIAAKHDFSGIRLLASNTISPQIRPLFDERVYFIRKSLSPYGMFSPGREYALEFSGPTVTNTGLEAALCLGFGELYLFGCDLGARSPERHHSRYSPYQMEGRKADYDAAFAFAQSFPLRQLGNFGGIVCTNDVMVWSRDAMESAIGVARGVRRIHNCSDGLRIRGAQPQVSSGIRLGGAKSRKQDTVARLMDHFVPASTFGFPAKWNGVDWRGRIRRYADRLIDVCDQAPERTQDFLHRMIPLLITDHQRTPTFEEFCLRGTMFVSIISADYYARRVHPPEKRGEFRAFVYAEMIELIELMVEQCNWFFDHVEEIETYHGLKESLRTWMDKRSQPQTA